MTLRVLLACVVCRRIGEADGFNLRFLWGNPAVCVACQKAKQ